VEEPPSPSFWQRIAGEGEDDEQVRPIRKPYGVAIHGGVIYVCDTLLGGIDVIDLENRSFDHWLPDGFGQLRKPINCATDKATGRLYVADIERGDVVVFGPDRRFVTAFGGVTASRPTDVFVAEGRAWVADLKHHEVRVYDLRSLEQVGVVPNAEADSADGLFGPTNVWVTDRHVYVSSFGAGQIRVYTHEGDYVRAVGSYGDGLGQFARPKGIAVDDAGVLYAVDAAFENVQLFNFEGEFLMPIAGPYHGPGDLWLPAQVTIDYDNVEYFRTYVHESLEPEYLILVTSQFGPDKINVYARVHPMDGAGAEAADESP
jgi:DNA-binding beta-propeller fold protein YncE